MSVMVFPKKIGVGRWGELYPYMHMFIHNIPSAVGSMIHPNRQNKYSFDTNNLALTSLPSK